MCGIAGIRRFGPEPITEEQIKALLIANQRRGNHATGIALQNPGEEIHILKNNEPAWNFTTSAAFKRFLAEHLREDTYVFLGHTRQATKGDPKEMSNNHPLYKDTTAVTHNGMIMNDDSLFARLKLARQGQVDSDIIRAILDDEGITVQGVRKLRQELSGSAAIAAISNEFPGKLLLARSGNPLVLAGTENQLIWSSEKNAIHLAMRPWVLRHGIWMQPTRVDVMWTAVSDHSAYIFDASGLSWHDEWKVAYTYNAPTYEVNKSYRTHRARFYNDSQRDVVQCPNVKCGKWLPLKKEHKRMALWELRCSYCKTDLAPEPEKV